MGFASNADNVLNASLVPGWCDSDVKTDEETNLRTDVENTM